MHKHGKRILMKLFTQAHWSSSQSHTQWRNWRWGKGV